MLNSRCSGAIGALPVLLLVAACTQRRSPNSEGSAKALDVDHIIVAIDSLNRGIEQLRQLTGVTAVYGAAHSGRGTHSAWMALGPRTYLEIQAPNPEDTTRSAYREDFTFRGLLTPAYWALHTRDAERLRAELIQRGLAVGEVVPGTRPRGPDTLRWRSLIPWGPLNRAILPYYMERIGRHPSSLSPGGCNLASITVTTPKADSIRALLKTVDVAVRVDSGLRDELAIELDCPTGRVKLPQAPSGLALMREKPSPTAAGVALGITRDSVHAILDTADVSVVVGNTNLLSFTRGRPAGLQVGLTDGRVNAVMLATPEAGLLDGMRVGLPFIRLFVRWGEPTLIEEARGAIWRSDGWEIIAYPDIEAQSIRVLELRARR